MAAIAAKSRELKHSVNSRNVMRVFGDSALRMTIALLCNKEDRAYHHGLPILDLSVNG